jgi:Ca-activated chloride channel family protein
MSKLIAAIARCATVVIVWLVLAGALPVHAKSVEPDCMSDAIIVLDASASMSRKSRAGALSRRIQQVRRALAIVLPQIERHRNLGLIVYGPLIGASHLFSPGCSNIELRIPPQLQAAQRIIGEVNALVPAGITSLTDAVQRAAEALNYTQRPATILLLTDGQETCGGSPCRVARQLQSTAHGLKVHVIHYDGAHQMDQSLPVKGAACFPDETGGAYVPDATLEELVAAFRKTLGCLMLSHAWKPRIRRKSLHAP